MIPVKPTYVVAAMFAAQVLGMASFVTFPGLLPIFREEWQLSNADAGWTSGVFFAGFAVMAAMILVWPIMTLIGRLRLT